MRRWICLLAAVLLLMGLIFSENIKIREAVSPNEYINAFKAVSAHVENADLSGLNEKRALILVKGGSVTEASSHNIASVLSYMKVQMEIIDLDCQQIPPLSSYDLVFFTMNTMQGCQSVMESLIQYATQGGSVYFTGGLSIDSVFMGYSQLMGIQEYGNQNQNVDQISFAPEFMPFDASDEMLGCVYIKNDAHPVQLIESFTPHVSAVLETGSYPILWSGPCGQGKIMVCSATLFEEKINRGLLAISISTLMETWIYPIIDAMVLFIDDFPAPLPEGDHPIIKEEYDRDILSFFQDIWWPDMQSIALSKQLVYTGLLVENYSEDTDPPFVFTADSELQKKFARSLTDNGGEIGLHGFNHVSLLPTDFYSNSTKSPLYPPWPNVSFMEQSLRELLRYGNTLLSGYDFVSYVPPSNLLSDEGVDALLRAVPQTFVIAGLYSGSPDDLEYITEISVDPRGFVNLPRLTSGMAIDADESWCMYNGMLMHGLVSHFIHPDDILDAERGKGMNWSQMRDDFDAAMDYVRSNMPDIESMTSTQAAIEVVKMDTLHLFMEQTENKLSVGVDQFMGETAFMLRLPAPPVQMTGCTLQSIGANFYVVHAQSANFSIEWETI